MQHQLTQENEIDGLGIPACDLEGVIRDDAEIFQRSENTHMVMKTPTTKAKELIAKVRSIVVSMEG